MGLSLSVGALSDILVNDPSEAERYRYDFRQLNSVLVGTGLNEHVEPEKLDEKSQFHRDMIGYNGLHYVRRIGAYLALGYDCPAPGPNYGEDFDSESSSVLEKYDSLFFEDEENLVVYLPKVSIISRLFKKPKQCSPEEKYFPFMHLMMHGDSDGVYIPQIFHTLRMFDAQSASLGLVIGSSHVLLDECLKVAKAIGIPEEYKFNDDDWDEVGDSQGAAGAGWRSYSIEAYGCLSLMDACKASLKTGAALVFQ